MIKAKFKVQSVTKYENNCESVELYPVTTGSEENKQWSEYTPGGKIQMTITAKGAVGKFEPGKEYYIDFTPA